MGAALQNLENLVPDSAVRRLLPRVEMVIAAWNRGAAPLTGARRREALAMFGAFAFRDRNASTAGARLLALGEHDATAAVAAWCRAMIRNDLHESTRDHRLTCVRSFVRMAQSLGVCSWRIRVSVDREPAEVPTTIEVEAAIIELERNRRRRDLALVLLAYDAALAIGEIVALRVRDVNFGDGSITTSKRRVALTPRTIAALRDAIDSDDDDPLFAGARGGELSPMSAWRIFRGLGLGSPDCVRKAGLEARDGG